MEVALKYKWNAEKRLVALEKKLTDVVREVREEGLESKLKLALRDSDVFIEKPFKETGRLYDVLVQANLVIYVNAPVLADRPVRRDPELSIGKYYA